MPRITSYARLNDRTLHVRALKPLLQGAVSLLILLMGPISAGAVEYTVCSSGCTYPTITAAVAALAPGVTITVLPLPSSVPYRERVNISGKYGSASSRAVLQAGGAIPAVVVIDGSDDYSNATWSQYQATSVYSCTTTVMNGAPTQVFVDNTRYRYVSGSAFDTLDAGEYGHNTTHVYVNVGGGSPGTKEVLIGNKNRDYGIRVHNSNYVTVRGFTVLRTADKGIHIEGGDSTVNRPRSVIVSDCISAQNWGPGIRLSNAVDCEVLRNTTYNNGSHGIHVAQVTDSCKIVRNVSYANDLPLATPPRGGKAGIKIEGLANRNVTNIMIDYNTVYDNEDTGIDLQNTRKMLVRRNNSYRNRDHGFDNNGTDQTVFLNNAAVRNDHDGMSVESGSDRVELYNNIFAYNALAPQSLANGSGSVRQMFIDDTTGFRSNYNVLIGDTPGQITNGYRFLVEFPGGSNAEYETFSEYLEKTVGYDDSSLTSYPSVADSADLDFRVTSGADSVIDMGKTDMTGWTSMWLATDAQGFSAHDYVAQSNVGVGTPTYSDIGPYEFNPPPAGRALQLTPSAEHAIYVNWSAPGDDSLVGNASTYMLRYSTESAIAINNYFLSCPSVPTDAPQTPGNQETYLVTGLPSCTVVYFGLMTQDSALNWSVKTTAYATTGCGGGGGGCNDDPNCYPESGRPADGYVVTHRDIMRLGDQTGAITLSQVGTVAFRLDSLALVEVTPGADSMAVVSGKEILLGAFEPAVHMRGNSGDITPAIGGSGFTAAAGETLRVRFASSEGARLGSALVIEAESADSDSGVRVLAPRGDGRWRAIARVAPRLGRGAAVVENLDADSVRLVFGNAYRVKAIRRVVPKSPPRSSRTVGIQSGKHSRLGVVAVPEGGASTVLEPGDMLRLDPVASEGSSIGRERLLGVRISAAGSAPTRQRDVSVANLPTEFGLKQNQPNPFGAGTTIRFALPVKSQVALEIFDVHGRRVRSLTRGEWKAGFHTLAWDGRDGAGQRVGPGLYLYRMEAGSFHASRKLVVLP